MDNLRPVMQEFYEIYKRYKLICTPTVSPDGKYRTKLVIEKDKRSSLEVFEVSVTPHTCATVEEAANIARIAGRMWVDDNG
jgi:hypothetical protein